METASPVDPLFDPENRAQNPDAFVEKKSSITVSLKWAKKLKEAGWGQEKASVHRWMQSITNEEKWYVTHLPEVYAKTYFAAPTAEEILRRLPKRLLLHGIEGRLIVCWDSLGRLTLVGYIQYPSNDWLFRDGPTYQDGMLYESDEITANAAAAMFCYLKEHNLLPKE